ncbi:transcriptional regulator domain-containing protein [Bradyrhizobium elkanii]|uniref:transcriptional regulator domain-containing protein n=1 Tax=Bradyrhizobium elkanii TaxID=29448 RepID=UPI003BACD13F
MWDPSIAKVKCSIAQVHQRGVVAGTQPEIVIIFGLQYPCVCVKDMWGSAMSGADWRSESTYNDVKRAETADMAWEWLRRDREYQKDFRAVLRCKRSGGTNRFRRKWGLTFSS